MAHLSDAALRHGRGVGAIFQRNLLAVHAQTYAVLEAAAADDEAAAAGSAAADAATAQAEGAVAILETVEDVAVALVVERKLAAVGKMEELAQQRVDELAEIDARRAASTPHRTAAPTYTPVD
jgi:hypothetical protein